MNVPRKLAGTATMQAVSLPDPSLWMREFAAHFELSRRQRPSAFHKSDFPVTWGFHVLRFRLFLLFTQLAPGGTLLPLPAPLWSSFSTLSQVIEEKMVIIITSVTTSGAKFSSVAQPCPTLCDPMSCSTPGLPVRHPTPESAIPSNHLILCHPLLLLPSVFPSIRVFSVRIVCLDLTLKKNLLRLKRGYKEMILLWLSHAKDLSLACEDASLARWSEQK